MRQGFCAAAVAVLGFGVPGLALAQGALENPQANAIESGIGVISGWHCSAREITVAVDGVSLGKAGSGTLRPDTASVCGGRSDTGFSLLYNFNRGNPGVHRIDVYADGTLWQSRSYVTVRSGGEEFLTGAAHVVQINDFPVPGKVATLTWSQARQSFLVTALTDSSAITREMCRRTQEIAGRWQLTVGGSAPFTATLVLGGDLVETDYADIPCLMLGTDGSGQRDVAVGYSSSLRQWVIVDVSDGYRDAYVVTMTTAARLDGTYWREYPNYTTPEVPVVGAWIGPAPLASHATMTHSLGAARPGTPLPRVTDVARRAVDILNRLR